MLKETPTESNPSLAGISIESRPYHDPTKKYVRAKDSLGQNVIESHLFNPIDLVDPGVRDHDTKITILAKDDQGRPTHILYTNAAPNFADVLYTAISEGTTSYVPPELQDTSKTRQIHYEYDSSGRLIKVTSFRLSGQLQEKEVFTTELITTFQYDSKGRIYLRVETDHDEQEGLGKVTLWNYSDHPDGVLATEYSYNPATYRDLQGGAYADKVNLILINPHNGNVLERVTYKRPIDVRDPEGVYTYYDAVKVWPDKVTFHKDKFNDDTAFTQAAPETVALPSYLTQPDVDKLTQGDSLDTVGTHGLGERPIEVQKISDYLAALREKNDINDILSLGDAVVKEKIRLLQPQPDWFSNSANILAIKQLSEPQKIALMSLFVIATLRAYKINGESVAVTLEKTFWQFVLLFLEMDKNQFYQALAVHKQQVTTESAKNYVDLLYNLDHIMLNGTYLNEWGDNLLSD